MDHGIASPPILPGIHLHWTFWWKMSFQHVQEEKLASQLSCCVFGSMGSAKLSSKCLAPLLNCLPEILEMVFPVDLLSSPPSQEESSILLVLTGECVMLKCSLARS